jgi:diaminopimelate epimerase
VMQLHLMSGAGNRFAVVDAFTQALPADMPQLARDVCAAVEPKVDGLLVAARPTRGGDCAMILYNADGSRPETCGNGLRCIAKLVRDQGHVTRDEFVIETDAGPCAAMVDRDQGQVTRARVHMGTPRIIARDVAIALAPDDTVRGTLVDVGNPHCVVFVDDERTAPVTTRGPRIERHALFPRGTNVEFLAVRNARVHVRVWERGVGETQACGSGACAAAVAAVERGLARFPVRIELPGGTLEVDDDRAKDGDRATTGGVFLTGPVVSEGTFAWNTRERRIDAPARRA